MKYAAAARSAVDATKLQPLVEVESVPAGTEADDRGMDATR